MCSGERVMGLKGKGCLFGVCMCSFLFFVLDDKVISTLFDN